MKGRDTLVCLKPISDFGADDDIDYYRVHTIDSNGQTTQNVDYNGPGADGIWFTAGDDVKSYYTYTLDASGNRIQWVKYNGAGADGVWFTADDDLERMNYYETDF